jgi:hypothetical protein
MLACSAVGILIVARRPGNVIGWIYLLVPLVMAASEVAGGYAGRLVVAQIGASLLPRPLFLLVSYTTFLLFPVATGIAVVRYRLYDIDRLINRTLVYALLTALLGGVYAGAVLVLGQVFGGVSSNSPSWAVTGASTGASTTPPRRSRRSAPAFVSRRDKAPWCDARMGVGSLLTTC